MDINENPIIIEDILQNYINNNNSINYTLSYNISNNYLNVIEDNLNNKYNNIYDHALLDNKNNKNDNINDPWENSINDNKFYINNKVARIFPLMKNFNNFGKIKIDDDSFSYITIREIADLISKIISYHLLEYNLNPQKIIIADYTSGVGGNVLSFAKYFKFIYAIEKSDIRSEYLKNNINVYGYKNIIVINKCAIEFNNNDLIKINPNVIFIDPPWGGNDYKNNENLLLNLGEFKIEELIINICKKYSDYYEELIKEKPKEKNNNYNTKIIVLKLPKNYNIEYLYNYIKLHNNFNNYVIKLYLYILNKMLIVIFELYYY